MKMPVSPFLLSASLLWLTTTCAPAQPAAGSAAAVATKSPASKATADDEQTRKAAEWVATLQLNDARKAAAVQEVIATHLKAVRAYGQAHPYTETPAGINPVTGKPLSTLDRQVITLSAQPKSTHDNLMSGLRQHLTPAQVEAILDQYTIGKVAFTLNGYRAIVPNLTATEEEVILTNLKQAREQAVDYYPSMKQISAIFEIYKTQNEQYLNTHGRNWREMFKAYVDAANARKAAEKAKNP